MSEEINICRLCISSQRLKNLYETDTLPLMTSSCIGLKLDPDDGLPSSICEPCEYTINKFYNFKQRCLLVDTKLRSGLNTIESTENTLKYESKLESELAKNFKSSDLESWVENQSTTEFDEKYFEIELMNVHEVYVKEEKEIQIENTYAMKESDNNSLEDKAAFKKAPKCRGTKTEKHQCELCGNLFKTKQTLEKHTTTHSGLKMFSCKLCPKQFTRAAHKVVHMRTHMGVRPYTCEICGKSATKRQDLIRHLRIHSDEKKYPCPKCDKRFKRSGDVHAHMRSHTGARPYRCNDCDKCYTSHSGLRKHYKTHCKQEKVIISEGNSQFN